MVEYRGYRIVGDGTYGMKQIKHIGRGACPKELLGHFLGYASAMKAIDLVLGKKEKDNGEDVSSD